MAIKMADGGGIGSLSMRKIAQSLDVEAMSLYNHISNKDAIVDGIVEIVAGEFELPGNDKAWKTAMRIRAKSMHAALLRHPWSTMELVSRINVGPSMLRFVDATLGCLVQAGFSYELADHAWNAMDSHIYGFTLQELNFPFKEEEYSAAAEDYLAATESYRFLNALSTRIMLGEYNGVHDFEFGLELILEGLDHLRNAAPKQKA